MNPQLIEKAIKSFNESCPAVTYKDPLLDPAVTKALSKSFVQVLTSKHNTTVDTNLRLSVLENIRKICKVHPEGHLNIHENHTAALVDVYKQAVFSNNTSEIDQKLSAFLIRTCKDTDMKSCYNIDINPELVQALLNLDSSIFNNLSDSIINWNTSDIRCSTILNNLWDQNILRSDVVIKMKPEIENMLLNLCVKVLENRSLDLNLELSDITYQRLLCTSAEVPNCFQICSSILNSVLTSTNYDSVILDLVYNFKCIIKTKSKDHFSSLYPTRLIHIVILLDVEIQDLPDDFKQDYIRKTVGYLKEMHNTSPKNFTMLLSHFPQWFNEC
ncbi:unnamed protein product [Pieris macdunnoughi]|uniref:Uncharacterized protein n=1 Tax=Pieris macdunnoughi TaxID=345717 RepID=A0A821RE06_9NEOP|nr:unnamed protein product [Pieris macdunnoughi]